MSLNNAFANLAGGGAGYPAGSFGLDKYTLQMSFMSYFRTGFPLVDQLLVSTVVGLILGLLSYLRPEVVQEYWKRFWMWCKPPKTTNENQIRITTKKIMSNQGEVRFDDIDSFQMRNDLLIEAFYVYMNKHIPKLKDSELAIDFNNHDFNFETYRDYWVNLRPLEEIKIQNFHIKFETVEKNMSQDEEEDTLGNGLKKTKKSSHVERSFEKILVIRSKLSTTEICKFIEDVWKDYVDDKWPEVRRNNKKPPKWYMIRKTSKIGPYYLKYNLTSPTTFDDIFFPGKDRLLRRITQFQDGDTKFSRFSILLHGQPGGGKTSFIKALHNYTGNHVIVVKLSQFDSVDELVDLFHNEIIVTSDQIINDSDDGRGLGGRLNRWNTGIPINKRIYLLEDIDAEDKIVLKRDESDSDNSDDEDEEEEEITPTDEKTKKSGSKKKKKKKPAVSPYGYFGSKFSRYDYGSDDEYGPGCAYPKWDRGAYSKDVYSKWKPEPKIKLADILNLLDGALELNGCFIIMTTNHIEKLDPALVRDGRITYKVKLSEITILNMKSMINKFIPEYIHTDAHPVLDKLLFELPPMMPCKFEQMVQHEFDLDSVIKNIQTAVDEYSQSDNSSESDMSK